MRSSETAFFLSFCIEQYKQRHHLTGEQAMQVLAEHDVLDYLEKHYEILHTQSAQWIVEDIDFVMKNRLNKDFAHDYDVVYGPVANDRVYACFALYESGVMSKESLLTELRTYDLVDQYLFHTKRSLQLLTFIKAKEILP